jgi:LysR family hydrogen peroxide-inducible transcriptional activator
MTLQQLRYIEALDRFRHFGRAAEACFVTQPTLTMQLRKLEEEMGVMLFDRSRQPIQPTPSGEFILAKAREILHHADQLYQFVQGEHTRVEGTFQLGVIPTLAPYLLPRFLPAFLNTYPDTRLVVRELQTARIIEQLRAGTLDIGLLVTPLNEQGIREIPLYNEPFKLFSLDKSVEGSVNPRDLPEEGMLLLEEGHCFREQALELCGQRTEGRVNNLDYRSGSIEALKSLVRSGMGYTLIPALAETAEDRELTHPFTSPIPVREVSLVVHNSFVRERLLEVLRDAIRQAVPPAYLSDEAFYTVRWRQM